jgi:hypothetical protein
VLSVLTYTSKLKAQQEYSINQIKKGNSVLFISSVPISNNALLNKESYINIASKIDEVLDASDIWFEEMESSSDGITYAATSESMTIRGSKVNFRLRVQFNSSEVEFIVDNHYIFSGVHEMSVEDYAYQHGLNPSMIYYDIHKRIAYQIIPRIVTYIKSIYYEKYH